MPEPDSYTLVRGDEVRHVAPDAFPAWYGQGWRAVDGPGKKAGTALQSDIDAARSDSVKQSDELAAADAKAIKAAGAVDAAATPEKASN